MMTIPKDLYIPPNALEVFLESFEGPLDLLSYLIKRQNIDILDIPIADITRQYIDYINAMKTLQFELAGEYLLMAAILLEIKSRLLLPSAAEAEEEQDPRAELIARLQQYERFKQASRSLDRLPRCERDIFISRVAFSIDHPPQKSPVVSLDELLQNLARVLLRADRLFHHHISREPLSVRERMSTILDRVNAQSFTDLSILYNMSEGRPGVIITLLAILELARESLLELTQNEFDGPIYIKASG